MTDKPRPTGSRTRSLLAICAAAGLLGGCGLAITSKQVLDRADRNLAAQNYRAAAVDLQNLVVKRPDDSSLHLKLAHAFLHVGRYVEAEANLREAQRLGTPWGKVLPELLEAMLQEGNAQKVLDTIAAHQRAGAPDEQLLSARGRALLMLGSLDEARTMLSQAIAANPADTEARIELALLLEHHGDFKEARSQIDQALATAPQDFSTHYALAFWYLRQARNGEGHAELLRALELAQAGILAGRDPDSEEMRSLYALSQVELATGDLSSVEKRAARLHKLAPHGTQTLIIEARLALAQKRIDDARAALQEVLSHNSGNQEAKVLLGQASAAAGDLGQADMYLTAALAANPKDANARKLLAEVQLREHKPQAALQTAANPTGASDADLLALAGRASLMTGDLADATQFFERSEKTAPQEKVRALELAAAYLAQKRPDDALKLLRGLEVPPELTLRRELLLLVALKAGSPAATGEEAQRFAAAHPRDMNALLLSAQALASVKDVDGARKLIDDAARLDSHSATPWVVLGALELSRKDWTAADQAFDRAVGLDPKNVSAELGEAEVALQSGKRDAAIPHLERARGLAPGLLSARLSLAQVYLEDGQFQKAATPLAEAERIAPNDTQAQLLRGAMALAEPDAASAVRIFEQLGTRYPKSAVIQADLARAYVLAKRPSDARNASAESIKLDPQYWPALVIQLELALDAGEQSSVSAMLKQLRASKAPPGIVQTVSGDLALRAGKLNLALEDYTTAAASVPSRALALKVAEVRRAMHAPNPNASLQDWLQSHPHDARVRITLAQSLQADGDRSAAMKEYQSALAEAPNEVVALNNLAWLNLEDGKNEAALALARKAYDKAPRAAPVEDTFGWALVKTGNTDDALPILRAAYRAAPKDTTVRFHYAYALLKTGATQQARQELQAIAEEQPRGPEGEQARSLLVGLSAPAGR